MRHQSCGCGARGRACPVQPTDRSQVGVGRVEGAAATMAARYSASKIPAGFTPGPSSPIRCALDGNQQPAEAGTGRRPQPRADQTDRVRGRNPGYGLRVAVEAQNSDDRRSSPLATLIDTGAPAAPATSQALAAGFNRHNASLLGNPDLTFVFRTTSAQGFK